MAEALSALCRTASRDETPRLDVVNADSLKREYPRRFGEVEFALPEFQQINQAAYWDYQRSKVYIRSSRRLHRVSRKARTERSIDRIRPNKVIRLEEQRRVPNCQCKDPLIYKWGASGQTVYDLRWSSNGIKRWVVRYVFPRYICWRCKGTHHQYIRKPRYGINLRSHILYQVIELQMTQNSVAKSICQLFGLPLSRGVINKVKAGGKLAGTKEPTKRSLIASLGVRWYMRMRRRSPSMARTDTYGCSRTWRKWHSYIAIHARPARLRES